MYMQFVFIYFDVVAEFLMLSVMHILQGTQANLVGSDPHPEVGWGRISRGKILGPESGPKR